MAANNLLFRILYYPVAVFKEIHRLGVNGSRNMNNRRRFPQSLIDDNVSINNTTVIAAHTHILEGAVVNHSTVSEYSYVGRKSIVQHTVIGKFCSIGSEVCIGLGKHPIEHFSTSTLFYRKQNTLKIELVDKNLDFEEYEPIEIGHDVWIGIRALIMDGVKIGTGAIVAANSVVTKDIPPYAIAAGVPAKIIGYRFNEQRIEELLSSLWWEKDLQDIKRENLQNI